MRKRKKPSSAVGLSMLDLISNAVAAIFILFILLSAIRLPPIPPERLEGQLIIRYEVIGAKLQGPQKGKMRFRIVEPENKNMPAEKLAPSWHPKIKGDEELDFESMIPYSPSDSQQVYYLVCDTPRVGEWTTTLQYSTHELFLENEKPAQLRISGWIIGAKIETWSFDSTQAIPFKSHPTNHFLLPFEVPKELAR